MKTESTYKAYRKTDITKAEILHGLDEIKQLSMHAKTQVVKLELEINPYHKPNRCPIKRPIYGCENICIYFKECIDSHKIKKICSQDIDLWAHNRLYNALAKL